MVVLRGLLLGGACGVGILGWSAAIDIGNAAIAVKKLASDSVVVRVADSSTATHMYFGDKTAPSNPAWAAPAKMNPDYQSAGSSASEAPAAEASSAEAPAQAAANDKATTNYYGDKAAPSSPAWAAPAKMNPDYQSAESSGSDSTAAEAPSAEAPTEAAANDKATTNYYGDKPAPQNPAWAAPAKMNPDYQNAASPASESTAAEALAAETPAAAAANDKATTNYYGDKTAPSNPAWAAPAKMNPEYSKAAAPAAQPSATMSEPAAAPVRNAAVEACREALTAAIPSVKLHFAESSYDVPSASRGALKKVAKIIGDCDGVVVEVNAFTDSTGGAEGNMRLSERRANAVVKFLTSAGVDASKLKAIGNGESQPITTNSTAEGRRKNRRVEFVVLSK